ncbi:L-histidine N(alpha)-methyltransferase [Pseudonocardia lacus]|uniref:L-histidine N(alpha)-methyltransferase n=1 Tax=Pseudonocardia lacus TaxID=2835865 RepID=UPI001BDCAEAA|nr:L-histidine N(alpha)-methyltransferase [Pseudonocardia lacus]
MTLLLDVHLTESDADAALRADALAGLTATPKWLPPKWFYDARGSELFERITELPEYYPTRTERTLLDRSADEIAAVSGADVLVELGSGSSAKTRLLLDAFTSPAHPGGGLRWYVPQDVSESALRQAMGTLADEYPGLRLRGVVGDFTRHLDRLPGGRHTPLPGGTRRMVAFLGGTIGNLLPAERDRFLTGLRAVLEPGEQMLLGTGLVVEPEVLVRAYDDGAGVTAEFNRNVLRVLNRELGADFDVDAFTHVALWDAEREWIEMRLRAERAMTVRLPELDLSVDFARGEQMRTEVSAKFRADRLGALFAGAGFALTRVWTDPDERHALSLATAA